MVEQNKERTVEVIQQEYQGLCLKAGHTQYQINILSKEMDILNENLRSLNFEASALQQKKAEAESKKVASIDSKAKKGKK